jgi:nucleotide-binding universal stress UspA family protein
MTTILVPIDGSALAAEALPAACALLQSEDRLLLLRVIPAAEPLTTPLTGTVVASQDEIGSIWRQAAEAELETAAAASGVDRSRIDLVVDAGEPAARIVAVAAERGDAIIVMSSHGRGAIGRAIFGSVADRVAHSATVPVLIVRPGKDALAAGAVLFRRIVVPLDGSELANEALPEAQKLAKHLGVPIQLVRAVDPTTWMPYAAGAEPAPALSPEVTVRIIDQARQEARDSLAASAATLAGSGVEVTQQVLEGSPFFAIADALQPGDLLVMTSHGRSGVQRWLMGSVAEKLVREAPVPVMIVPTPQRREG